MVLPQEVGIRRHHVPAYIKIMHVLGIYHAVQQPYDEASRLLRRGPVAIQPQAIRVRRIEKDFLRGQRYGDVGIRHIECDVAPVGLLIAQG